MSRFNVVGTINSGKSTFSKKLAANLQSQHIQIDQVYWGQSGQSRRMRFSFQG
jgi:adenylate kinase family enzyme